ncbi:hypothetical protein ACTMTF_36190 [Nonomuraea sp. ZG12]|uniref:hypothetical protein n=1 Tax=Nonomuraea sp. ZG12 TaxID=3452207 RepID=UPI003F8A16DD
MSTPALDTALADLIATFRGMTAHPDEHYCECRWSKGEGLALLRTPDTWLQPRLLWRMWWSPDWDDHAAVLRRILPQLAYSLVKGWVEPIGDMSEVGRSLAFGDWQQWPAEQAAAVRGFLHSWWEHSLTTPDIAVPAYEVLTLCVEASGTFTPWLDAWEPLSDPVADRRLAEIVARWGPDLLENQFPWHTRNDEQAQHAELTTWLVRHAPARLRAADTPDQLLQWVRLLGLPEPARWDDPYWDDHS